MGQMQCDLTKPAARKKPATASVNRSSVTEAGRGIDRIGRFVFWVLGKQRGERMLRAATVRGLPIADACRKCFEEGHAGFNWGGRCVFESARSGCWDGRCATRCSGPAASWDSKASASTPSGTPPEPGCARLARAPMSLV